ncbi:hypothetical protein K0M31_002142 [Melipona bicolor]|uniref:Uncharacterized protein n=1 Tax=Melipona bicolor TaxID=60889 RepID=A0AA40KY92_9HYME|nr:hypothetical protein K0M31_002142 [Melipona bicolor]
MNPLTCTNRCSSTDESPNGTQPCPRALFECLRSETPHERPRDERRNKERKKRKGGRGNAEAPAAKEEDRQPSCAAQSGHVHSPTVEKRLCVRGYSTSYHLATLGRGEEGTRTERPRSTADTQTLAPRPRERRYQRYVCTVIHG